MDAFLDKYCPWGGVCWHICGLSVIAAICAFCALPVFFG